MTYFLAAVNIAIMAVLHYFGQNFRSLDTRLFYSPADIYALFDQLGVEGRHSYTYLERFDLLFILAYSLFLRRISRDRITKYFVVATALVDLCETSGIIYLLAQYPTQSPVATIVAVCTPLKWAACAGIFYCFSRTFFKASVS